MMATFRYKAFAPDGRALDGTIEAASRKAAIDELHRRRVFPFDVAEGGPVDTTPWWQREVFSGAGLPSSSLATLIRELATLIQADLPIDEALRILASQPMLGARTRNVVRELLAKIEAGAPLSEAMAAAGGSFPAHTWQIVKAGEASGTLAPALADLAQSLELTEKVHQQVRSATLYPLVLLAVAGVAIGLVLFVLIPALGPLFKGVGAELPLSLRVLDGVRSALVGEPVVTALIVAALVGGWLAVRRNRSWRLFRDGLVLRIPGLATLVTYRETGRLARTLATLLHSGVPLLDAMSVASGVVANSRFADALAAATERVRQGTGLAAALAEGGRIPETAIRLISVGERSGEIDAMAARVAEIYETAFQRNVERATSLLAPLLTVLIGGLVGTLILSVISATLSLNELAWR